MDDFDRAAISRWNLGLAEYRKSPDDPFVGDPVCEAMEECLDIRNYVIVAHEAHMIPDALATEIISTVAQTWTILRKFQGVEIGDRIETGLDDPKAIPARGCE